MARDWVGTKAGNAILAVHRNADPEGERTVIREADFDDQTMTLIGDGSVSEYDPTETAEAAARKKTEAAKATVQRETAEAAVAAATPPKRGPGRPKGS